MTAPILSTQHLSIGYTSKKNPAKQIAQNLNLNLYPKKLVCLLGPNGAGKSTLMRTLSGLHQPISGSITIEGKNIAAIDMSEMAKSLSLVLTERIQTGNLTVQEIVALGRTPYTNWLGKLSTFDHEKIDWAMQATDTKQYAKRQISQLSDGEKQKVMLARALAQDTNIIILDEPTAHLDLPHRVEMMHLLHQLAHQMDKAILLSTHELDLALQTADELWLMKPEQPIVTGMPEDLVLSGAFETAFARPGFNFDLATGTFNIQSPSMQFSVFIESENSNHLFWTKRALTRAGIFADADRDHPIRISIKENQSETYWKVCNANVSHSFKSLEALLLYLSK